MASKSAGAHFNTEQNSGHCLSLPGLGDYDETEVVLVINQACTISTFFIFSFFSAAEAANSEAKVSLCSRSTLSQVWIKTYLRTQCVSSSTTVRDTVAQSFQNGLTILSFFFTIFFIDSWPG